MANFVALVQWLDEPRWGKFVNHSCRGKSRLGLGPKSGLIGGRVKPRALVEVRPLGRVIWNFGVGFGRAMFVSLDEGLDGSSWGQVVNLSCRRGLGLEPYGSSLGCVSWVEA